MALCESCNGTGDVGTSSPCYNCDGSGVYTSQDEYLAMLDYQTSEDYRGNYVMFRIDRKNLEARGMLAVGAVKFDLGRRKYWETAAVRAEREADEVAHATNAIRRAAGNALETCPTCCRPVGRPARRVGNDDDRDLVIEGCVDACHGEPDAWASRPQARLIRASTLAALVSM